MRREFLIALIVLGWAGVPSARAVPGNPADPDEGVQLAEETPLAKGFKAYGGRWQMKNGVLSVGADAGAKLVLEQPVVAEGEVSVDMLMSEKKSGSAGLIVKVSEPGVGADGFNGYEISLDAQRQMLRLGRHRQDFKLIKDLPCAVPLGQWFPVAVRMTSKSLEVMVSGQSVITYEDNDHPLTSGAVGFRPWQREAKFRNFQITTGGRTRTFPFETQVTRSPCPPSLFVKGLPPIAVVTRHPFNAPPAVGQDIWAARPRTPGCSIRIFDPTRPGQSAKTIFDDPDGCIYDMNLSFDARTLFFSYQREEEAHWHIWRIGVDGSGLKQLTDGPFYDISPCETPNGDIVFVSTRRFGYTLCQPGPASNLHVMSPDGSNIRCVSMNTLSDLSPQMLPDGRVLFTRWEYVDRDLTFRQSLWTQYPDGTSYQLYFGNTIRDVGTFWEARPLPGRSDRLVATFAPHHGFPHGAIGFVERNFGPEAPKGKGFSYITKEFPSIGDTRHEWSYRDPFPLTDRTFLCAYGGGGVNRYRIFLLDADDNKRLLYEDPDMGCYFPIPLRPTPVPVAIPSRVQTASEDAWGVVMLADVYRGLEPVIQRGRVKSLRVMEQVRKTEDLKSRAFDQSPVMSYGTYYAKRCWSTVPVEADGSAHFRVPAMREIYFQVLDAEGRELQRMTSAAQLMPGEHVGCIGCHETRQSSGPVDARPPLAAGHPPRALAKPAWGHDGIVGFPTLVQPVLDKYCVRCHRGGNPAGGCDLTGDKTRYFNMAYDNLLGRSQSYRQHNMETGEMLPEEAAKGKPLVHFYWLLRTPSAVNQPLWTGCYASRLTEIVDSDHGGQKIPLEDRQRIYLWMDANVPYYGTYANSRPLSPGKRDLWTDVETGHLSAWFERDFSGVYNRRCASCHGKYEKTTDWTGRFAWINLTHPNLSPALTAHLSKTAGGRGITKSRQGRMPPLFADTTDPDYQTMLQAVETGRKLMLATPEADMPGFKGARPEP